MSDKSDHRGRPFIHPSPNINKTISMNNVLPKSTPMVNQTNSISNMYQQQKNKKSHSHRYLPRDSSKLDNFAFIDKEIKKEMLSPKPLSAIPSMGPTSDVVDGRHRISSLPPQTLITLTTIPSDETPLPDAYTKRTGYPSIDEIPQLDEKGDADRDKHSFVLSPNAMKPALVLTGESIPWTAFSQQYTPQMPSPNLKSLQMQNVVSTDSFHLDSPTPSTATSLARKRTIEYVKPSITPQKTFKEEIAESWPGLDDIVKGYRKEYLG
eukprot:144319_1